MFRLKTRNVAFSIKQVTEFNDLYQNISILTKDGDRYETCKRFAEYITENNSDINKLGLFSHNAEKCDDELQCLQGYNYEHTLQSPCSGEYLSALKDAAANNDLNKLKNLLK